MSEESQDPHLSELERVKLPFARIRRALLGGSILLVVFTAGVIITYSYGRPEKQAGITRKVGLQGSSGGKDSAVGVDFTQTSNGLPIFRVRANRSQHENDDRSRLEGVTFDFFQGRNVAYTLNCRTALVDQKTNEAQLDGDVVVISSDGLTLKAQQMVLSQEGKRLESNGPVEFNFRGRIEGRSNKMELDRQSETIMFGDGAHLKGLETLPYRFSLDSDTLFFNHDEQIIRASGKAVAQINESYFRADILSVIISSGGQTLQELRAKGEVSAKVEMISGTGEPLIADILSSTLVLRQSEGIGGGELFVEGLPEVQAQIHLEYDDGMQYVLSAFNIRAEIAADHGIRLIEGLGDSVELQQSLNLRGGTFVIRRVCSRSLVVRLEDESRQISEIHLTDSVSISDNRLQISNADSGNLDYRGGSFSLKGAPVLVSTEMGEVYAPIVQYSEATGVLRASGKVETIFSDSPRYSQNALATRVNSEQLIWSSHDSQLTFVGSVQAWQGKDLLLADQLRYDLIRRTATAGNAIEILIAPKGKGTSTQAADRANFGNLEKIKAKTLIFDGMSIALEGDIQAISGDNELRCDRLILARAGVQNPQPDKITCEGRVELRDFRTSSRATGQRAIFDVAANRVDIFGKPARLFDRANNTLAGEHLTVDLKTGKSTIRGAQGPKGLNQQ